MLRQLFKGGDKTSFKKLSIYPCEGRDMLNIPNKRTQKTNEKGPCRNRWSKISPELPQRTHLFGFCMRGGSLVSVRWWWDNISSHRQEAQSIFCKMKLHENLLLLFVLVIRLVTSINDPRLRPSWKEGNQKPHYIDIIRVWDYHLSFLSQTLGFAIFSALCRLYMGELPLSSRSTLAFGSHWRVYNKI